MTHHLNPPTLRPECGTYGGYQRHRRAGETKCDACQRARKEYEQARRGGPATGERKKRGVDDRYQHGWESLLEHIAEGNTLLIPGRLDGAKCNPNNAHLFDIPTVDDTGLSPREVAALARQRRAAAERLCASCPARTRCAEWATTQRDDKRRPAGAYLPTPTPRQETAA